MVETAKIWRENALRHFQAPLFGNAYFLILTYFAPLASGFLFWIMAAKLMPAEKVGWGSALLSVSALLVSLSGLDLGTGLIRFVPLSLAQSPERINAAIWLRGGLASVAALAFLAGASVWSPALASINTSKTIIALFVVGTIVLSINELLEHAFVAYRSAHFALWKSLIVSLGRFPILAFLAMTAADGGFEIYLSTVIPAGVASIVAVLYFLPQAFPAYRLRWQFSPALLLDMVRYSLANHLVTFLLQLPVLIIPALVINTALGPAAAGIAYISSMVATTTLLIPAAISRSLLAEGAHTTEHLPTQTRKALVFSFGLLVLPVAVLTLLGPFILGLLFGPAYQQQGSGLLVLLALSALPATLIAIYVSLQRVRNQMKTLIGVAIATSLTSVGLEGWLVHVWGLSGLGIGLLVGQLVGGALTVAEIAKTAYSSRPLGQPTDYSSLKKTLDCIIDEVTAQLPPAPRLLDVGCGTGVVASRLRQRLGGFGVGVDVDEQPLRLAAAHYKHEPTGFARYDGYQLPFADGQFHLILLHEVIEHVPEPERLLNDIQRNVALGGLVIITTPNATLHPFSGNAHPDHIRHFTVSQLRRLVEQTGLEVVDQFYRCHPLGNGLDHLLIGIAKRALPIRDVQPHMATLQRPSAYPLFQFYHDWVDPLITWIEQTEFRLRRRQPALDQVCICRKPLEAEQ